MANQNPEAIRVSNEIVRPLADGKRLFLGVDVIDDGAAVDGRHIITNQDARLLLLDMKQYINDIGR